MIIRNIVIGSSYTGWELKREVRGFILGQLGRNCLIDVSKEKPRPEYDYPRIAEEVAYIVADVRKEAVGILIDGTGMGMAMAVNKVKGIRAAACYTPGMAVSARQQYNLNVLCLSSDILAPTLALEIVKVWIETPFVHVGDYHRQITQIGEIEAKQGFLESYIRMAGPIVREGREA